MLPIVLLKIVGNVTGLSFITDYLDTEMTMKLPMIVVGLILCTIGVLTFGHNWALYHLTLDGAVAVLFTVFGIGLLCSIPKKHLPQLRPRETPPALQASSPKPVPEEDPGRWMQ